MLDLFAISVTPICTPFTLLEKGAQPKTLLDHGNYEELYATSINDPQFFWGTLAKQVLLWDKPFDKVMECNMEEGKIKWFTGGRLNVSGTL